MSVIGFVGLGQMGSAMSRNLIKAGHTLQVYDIDPAAVATVAAAGATAAASPAEAARGAEAVFTILPIGATVEAACFDQDGIASGMTKGAVLVDMSTILPAETTRIGARLATAGIGMVDAPVGRTSAHAVAGTSTFMVGGEAADIERVRPFLLAMGEAVTVCGPLGSGATMKLINNYISAVVNLVTAEGMALGLKAGLAQEVMAEVLSHTPAGQGHIRTTWPEKALKDDPSPAFMLDLATKDLGLAADLAASLKAPLSTGAIARQFYQIAQNRGYGRDDWTTALYRTLKALNGS